MYNEGLSLSQSPPLKASLPFFLTAPLFLILGACVLFFFEINPLERWPADTVGLIHFFNLGFLLMTMMGALTQLLPVLCGVAIPHVLLVSRTCYGALVLGAISFPLGLILTNKILIQLGAISALSSVFLFFSICSITLLKGIKSPTLSNFKMASLSGLITFVLALILASGWAEWIPFPMGRLPMIELHIGWGIFGLIFSFIMGVTYKVIPMFYVTPAHSPWLSRYSAKIIFSLLILWTILFTAFIFDKWVFLQVLIPYIKMGISLIVLIFSIETLVRIKERKRPITDTSLLYWKLAMVLFSLGVLFYSVSQFIEREDKIAVLSGILIGSGLVSLIIGMLYKIIPFLIWFHLTSKGISNVPTMRELISDRLSRKQFYLHLICLSFLFSSLFFFLFLPAYFSGLKIAFSLSLFLSSLFVFIIVLKPVGIFFKKKSTLIK